MTLKFLSLATELHSYILSFLPWQDVLRCSSVCKALRQTYMSSSELQYVVELGGQRLLPVQNRDLDSQTSIAQRLQLLRDKARAWFRYKISVAGGHLCMWYEEEDLAKIFSVLPKPSQQTIERVWTPRLSCSVPNIRHIGSAFMDPMQNLIAIAYTIIDDHLQSNNENFYIDIGSMDVDGVHPQAAGPILFPSGLSGYENRGIVIKKLKLDGLGRHIAFWRFLMISNASNTQYEGIWSLQIWDWQHSTTSNSILNGVADAAYDEDSVDFCLLGNNRLLIVSNELKLYSIEDMSRAPQLLARFLLPLFNGLRIPCYFIMGDSAERQMQQQTMWALDPKHRLLCVLMLPLLADLVFIISTNIFFDLDAFEGAETPIPWKNWGPSNSRVFASQTPPIVSVSRNRVLYRSRYVATTANSVCPIETKLHMMDFSPLAVEHRQGRGRVVTEPSTLTVIGSKEILMTSLPYVEVISDRTFCGILEIHLSMDGIVLLTNATGIADGDETLGHFEVIEI